MIHIDVLIAIVLVLIMFGIGLSLTTSEVKEVIAKPKALIIAMISQMVLLPIIAFAIAFLFQPPIYIQIGLVILAASPGGTTAGFITYLFKGNVALSVVLTTINSLLTLLSIPLIVSLALHQFLGSNEVLHLPIWETIKEIFIVTAIPVSIGIFIRLNYEKIALTLSKYTKPISILLLGIVFTLKFFGGSGEEGMKLDEILEILPYALLLNILCYAVGYFVAISFRLGEKNELTISIESAVHNTTIAFLVAGPILGKPEFGKVSLVYALFSFWTALLFSLFLRYRHKKALND